METKPVPNAGKEPKESSWGGTRKHLGTTTPATPNKRSPPGTGRALVPPHSAREQDRHRRAGIAGGEPAPEPGSRQPPQPGSGRCCSGSPGPTPLPWGPPASAPSALPLHAHPTESSRLLLAQISTLPVARPRNASSPKMGTVIRGGEVPHAAQIQSAHAHPTLAHRSYFRKSEIKDGWRSSYKRSRAIVISNKNSPSVEVFSPFFFKAPQKFSSNSRQSAKHTEETQPEPFPTPPKLSVISLSLPPSLYPHPASSLRLGEALGIPSHEAAAPRGTRRRLRGRGGSVRGIAGPGRARGSAALRSRPKLSPPENSEEPLPRSAPRGVQPPKNPGGSRGSAPGRARGGKGAGDEARGWKKPRGKRPSLPAAACAHQPSWDPRPLRAPSALTTCSIWGLLLGVDVLGLRLLPSRHGAPASGACNSSNYFPLHNKFLELGNLGGMRMSE